MKSAVKKILPIAASLIIAQLAVIGNSLSDVYFSNSHSLQAAAIVGLASSIWVTAAATLVALMHGLSPIIAQQWGSKDYVCMAKSLKAGAMVALVSSLSITLFIHFCSGWLLRVFGVPDELEAPVTSWLDIAILALPAIAFARLYFILASTTDRQKTVIYVNVFALLVKIVVTWVLIDGKFGFSPQGADACAISLVVMFCVSLAASLCFLYGQHFVEIRKILFITRLEAAAIQDMLKLGIPIAISQFSEVASLTILSLIIAPLGATFIAAHQILSAITTFSFTFAYGIGLAAQIMIARSIGEEKWNHAVQYSRCGVALSSLVALILCIFYFVFKTNMVAIFTVDLSLSSILISIFPLFCAYLFFDAAQTAINSSLRGFKIVLFPSFAYTGLLWIVGVGGGWAMCYGLVSIPYPEAFLAAKVAPGLTGVWVAGVLSLFLISSLLLARLHFSERVKVGAAIRY